MTLLSRHFFLFSRSNVGSAAVEFALVLPMLLLLVLGTIEYGRLLWVQNSIQYAVEQAARCAVMGQANGATNPPACLNQSQTQSYAVQRIAGITVAPGAIAVAYQCPATGAGCTVVAPGCGVAGTKAVLVSASVPFAPILSSSPLLPFEGSLSIILKGQSCRPIYT